MKRHGTPAASIANMDSTHVAKLMQLDPEGVNGTLQFLLLNCGDIEKISFEDFLYKALSATMHYNNKLVEDNIRLSRELNDGKL